MTLRSARKPTHTAVTLMVALGTLLSVPAARAQGNGATGLHKTKATSGDSGSVSFLPAVTYNAGGSNPGGPGSVVVADLNRDGRPDLVVANTPAGGGDSSVGVLLGNGDGTFQPALVNTSVPGVGEFNALAVADVNRDGKPDVVVAACCGNNGDNQVAVLLGNGDGTFQPAVIYDAGGNQGSPVVVGDVNGDGHPDIVVVNWGSSENKSTISVLLGKGDGTFQPVVSSDAPPDPSCATLVDVNHDGKPDLLTCTEDSVAVQFGNGDGTFQTWVNTYFYSGFDDSAIMVVDVNADGLPDIVVSDTGDLGSHSGFAGVLLGNGDGTFQTEVNYLALVYTHIGIGQGAVSDLNGDGKLDVMVTTGLGIYGSVHGSVGVVLGNGDGTFQTATTFDAGGSQTVDVVAADLNGDGRPDIIVGNFGSHTVGVLLNNTGSPLTTTTTSVTSSANPGHLHKTINYTATVTSQDGSAVTGAVTFQDSGATIGTADVSGNQAAYSTSYTAEGTHFITATYSGDGGHSRSTSPVLVQIVVRGETPPYKTTTTLSASGPTFVGQPVTFTASVVPAFGVIPDGDSVKFFVGNQGLGFGSTVNGSASITTSSITAGVHHIQADYLGDPMFKGSYTIVKYEVLRYPTTTTLVGNPNPAVVGQPITYSATVTSAGPDAPTGNVKLTGIGLVPLVNGVATYTKAKVSVGTHSLTAEYKGDAASAPSTSEVLVEVVNPD